jgi:hypothetical protein
MFMVSRTHKNQAHSLCDTDLELWIKEAATKNHSTTKEAALKAILWCEWEAEIYPLLSANPCWWESHKQGYVITKVIAIICNPDCNYNHDCRLQSLLLHPCQMPGLQSCLQSIAIMIAITTAISTFKLFMQAFVCAKDWWCQQTDRVGSRSVSADKLCWQQVISHLASCTCCGICMLLIAANGCCNMTTTMASTESVEARFHCS